MQQDPHGGRRHREFAALPVPSPHSEDTLARGAGDVLARWRRALQFLGIGEGAQQPHLEVLTTLVLLAPVNEDLVLWGRKVAAHPSMLRLRSGAGEPSAPCFSCIEPRCFRGAGADKAGSLAKRETPLSKKIFSQTQQLQEKGIKGWAGLGSQGSGGKLFSWAHSNRGLQSVDTETHPGDCKESLKPM